MSTEKKSGLMDGVLSLPWETADTSANAPEDLASLFEEQTSEEAPDAENESEPVETGEPEPAEAQAEEVQEDEELDSEEDEVETPATVKVKVDGEEIEVSLDEALKGYSRTQDYTRKTQKLSEERKAFEAEATAVRAEREQYAQQLQQLSQILAAQMPAEPNWDKLLAENPNDFAVQKAQWDLRMQQRAAIAAEQQRIADQQTAEFEKQRDAVVAAEAAKLVEAIPAWKDEAKAVEGKRELVEYAHGLGYTDEQLQQVVDHRVLVMLHKAMQFDRLQKKSKELRQTPEKVLPPGAVKGPNGAANKRNRDALQKARAKLARSGRVEDAAKVFEMLL